VKEALTGAGASGMTVTEVKGFGRGRALRPHRKVGDGKLFAYEVAEAVRLRTGERGDLAL
jgi:nitrogen regulatory protein PII